MLFALENDKGCLRLAFFHPALHPPVSVPPRARAAMDPRIQIQQLWERWCQSRGDRLLGGGPGPATVRGSAETRGWRVQQELFPGPWRLHLL